jgi:hypothetical protein
MHPGVTMIAAQQHIADLHRAADRYRLVHTATSASRSHPVSAPRHTAAVPVSFLDRRGSRAEGRAEVRCARPLDGCGVGSVRSGEVVTHGC